MYFVDPQDNRRIEQRARQYRDTYPAFAHWSAGYGVVTHSDQTQVRVFDLCQQLICEGRFQRIDEVLEVLSAADRVTSAAMWLVVHMTYSTTVDLSGRELETDDFKTNPQGHTGGSLNMVPAYVGYMVANRLAGITRSWLMGQGHCVAAIEAVNVLLQNLHAEQVARYPLSDEGLSQLARDFYSYAIDDKGRPGVPLGSHVNPHTAGGLIEGGYLGFAELQYVHMPLPGERLVAFLSDGAFEEQRGSDWASRWWRAEDCGLVTPVMIANGRRIDQRSTMYQQGGLSWFYEHLEQNGFHPIAIDGRDPAAFVWGVFEAESRLQACCDAHSADHTRYPVKLPYLIAETEKGYGFYGAGTNAAHGTPLPGNPRSDEQSRQLFNEHASKLHVNRQTLDDCLSHLLQHDADQRLQEKDHPLSRRDVSLQHPGTAEEYHLGDAASPMSAVDARFCQWHQANPDIRVRVGNPDELRSNRMNQTLDLLKHRVLSPEAGVAESLHGSVITALNEEAVVSAALGNKGGLNLVVSYEAFAMKMVGALRQTIIFARHQKELSRAPKWLSVPVIATSHLWENGKNEQSHQDSAFGEVLMGEMSDMARVQYPADATSAAACIDACYQSQGQIWAMTIPKQELETTFSPEEAKQLVEQGALVVEEGDAAEVELVAVGGYQLQVCKAVKEALTGRGVQCRISYLLEPGRFRLPRDDYEQDFVVEPGRQYQLFKKDIRLRVFVSHLRPEVLMGVCRPLDLGPERCLAFGYRNRGGTFDTEGLLRANACDPQTITKQIQQQLKNLSQLPGS
ncbi:xylulose 5-phosphate 3-epimerase [Spongiibacter nanhainus]|uniref:Xylulose 5-phosphate 3-epimerase n=1 Tax=Spongiibacter nanhainus TaxID=2794344 RepID=A0A7T4R415_9GAMM|nr:xylulose 5-phosphate 3-epimerase [Spongiibacter nanhainus]QQD19937.1 xylulose 5-phosphate 3-epimerase [Spongiibacter nanhainus]